MKMQTLLVVLLGALCIVMLISIPCSSGGYDYLKVQLPNGPSIIDTGITVSSSEFDFDLVASWSLLSGIPANTVECFASIYGQGEECYEAIIFAYGATSGRETRVGSVDVADDCVLIYLQVKDSPYYDLGPYDYAWLKIIW